jgi:hypothetical protein
MAARGIPGRTCSPPTTIGSPRLRFRYCCAASSTMRLRIPSSCLPLRRSMQMPGGEPNARALAARFANPEETHTHPCASAASRLGSIGETVTTEPGSFPPQ